MFGYGSSACILGGLGVGGFGGGSLMPILLIGFLVYYFLIRPNHHGTNPLRSVHSEPAAISSMEILNRKLASGELTEAEYLRKRDLLRQ